eukprot:818601-Prymnesium_polylepis.1
MDPSLSRPARLDSPSRLPEIWNGNDVVQATYEGAAPRPSPHARSRKGISLSQLPCLLLHLKQLLLGDSPWEANAASPGLPRRRRARGYQSGCYALPLTL